jgi:hypothetical protein
MAKILLAVDPGSSGGYAFKSSESELVVAGNLPDNDSDTIELLREIRGQADQCELSIEDVASFGGPAIAAAMSKLFGHKRFIEGAAVALGFRVVNVSPKKWQKHFSLGKKKGCSSAGEWKRKLKSEAQKRFPDIRVTLSTADALLILEHSMSAPSLL